MAGTSDLQAALFDRYFEALALGQPNGSITISRLAADAGLDVATSLQVAVSPMALFDVFARHIDSLMLQSFDTSLLDEPERERLFDLLMARIDAMEPWRDGLSALFAQSRRDPALALALNAVALRSMAMTLDAAGIPMANALGSLKVQALALGFSRVLEAWFKDEDDDRPKTLAELDAQLKRGETFFGGFDRMRRRWIDPRSEGDGDQGGTV